MKFFYWMFMNVCGMFAIPLIMTGLTYPSLGAFASGVLCLAGAYAGWQCFLELDRES